MFNHQQFIRLNREICLLDVYKRWQYWSFLDVHWKITTYYSNECPIASYIYTTWKRFHSMSKKLLTQASCKFPAVADKVVGQWKVPAWDLASHWVQICVWEQWLREIRFDQSSNRGLYTMCSLEYLLLSTDNYISCEGGLASSRQTIMLHLVIGLLHYILHKCWVY